MFHGSSYGRSTRWIQSISLTNLVLNTHIWLLFGAYIHIWFFLICSVIPMVQMWRRAHGRRHARRQAELRFWVARWLLGLSSRPGAHNTTRCDLHQCNSELRLRLHALLLWCMSSWGGRGMYSRRYTDVLLMNGSTEAHRWRRSSCCICYCRLCTRTKTNKLLSQSRRSLLPAYFPLMHARHHVSTMCI